MLLFLQACTDVAPIDSTHDSSVELDADGDGFLVDEDCDDTSATTYPGAIETCDGLDNDCDGAIDEDVAETFYADVDGDGYGDPAAVIEACELPEDAATTGTDCDDTAAYTYPGAGEACDDADNDCDGEVDEDLDFDWYADTDGDGYGDPDAHLHQCEVAEGHVRDATDCDDTSAEIHPETSWYLDEDADGYGSTERVECDPGEGYVLVGEDCDDADPLVHPETSWHADVDEDTYGDPDVATVQCEQPDGTVLDDQDCDDADPLVHPETVWYADVDEDGYGDPDTALEQCAEPAGYIHTDGTDCDDADPDVNPTTTWYTDADGDGYGDDATAVVQCEQPTDGVLVGGDCDDADGTLDPDTVWYADADSDGYGDASTTQVQCEQPSGYIRSNASDCDDTDPELNPDTYWYADSDSDGYGDPTTILVQCAEPSGYVLDDQDCDDTDPDTNPDTVWYEDGDEDGYGDASSATASCEQPSGFVSDDQDCDDSDPDLHPDTVWYADSDEDGYGDAATSTVQCVEPSGYVLDDQDCDDGDDEVWFESTWYADVDEDGWGDASSTTESCHEPSGYTDDDTDCDDTDEDVHPGATEVCDDVDNDCDSSNDPDILVPDDEATISDALSAAWSDDWICVLAGTYAEGELDITRRVVLEGEARDRVVLDGGSDTQALKVGVDDLEVRNLTISGGSDFVVWVDYNHTGAVFEDILIEGESPDYRLIHHANNTEAVWRRLDLIGNDIDETYAYGGMVWVALNADVTLENTRVLDNAQSGWSQVLGLIHNESGYLDMVNVIVANNVLEAADTSAWIGGAVFTGGGATTYAENVSIVGNSADAGTGTITSIGWYTYGSADTVELVNVDISHNVALSYGSGQAGGFYGHADASVTASYTNVYGNDIDDWHSNHDPVGSDGNISADPDYTDVSSSSAEDWDLTPGSSSALTDAGDPSLTDVDGSTSDIGALGGALGASFFE